MSLKLTEPQFSYLIYSSRQSAVEGGLVLVVRRLRRVLVRYRHVYGLLYMSGTRLRKIKTLGRIYKGL